MDLKGGLDMLNVLDSQRFNELGLFGAHHILVYDIHEFLVQILFAC